MFMKSDHCSIRPHELNSTRVLLRAVPRRGVHTCTTRLYGPAVTVAALTVANQPTLFAGDVCRLSFENICHDRLTTCTFTLNAGMHMHSIQVMHGPIRHQCASQDHQVHKGMPVHSGVPHPAHVACPGTTPGRAGMA